MKARRAMRRARCFGLGCLGFLLLQMPQGAHAQSLEVELAAAEVAYSEINFSEVRRWATSALEYGTATPEQLARLHVLLGIAAATAGEVDAAKQHFIVALALQPELRLERTLSPKIRDPYLEAQGYWGTFPDRLRLSAEAFDGTSGITVNLVDPAQLATEVVVQFRAPGATEYSEIVLPNARSQQTRLKEAFRQTGFEYCVVAADRFGNMLSLVGTEAAPLQARGLARAAEAPTSSSYADLYDDQPTPEPEVKSASGSSAWVPALLGAAGLGAAGVGLYFHLRREAYAHQWNSVECEQPGSTRGEQCVGVDTRRQRAEELAIGFYLGAAAALVAGSVVLFASAPAADSQSALACGAGFLSVGCSGHF